MNFQAVRETVGCGEKWVRLQRNNRRKPGADQNLYCNNTSTAATSTVLAWRQTGKLGKKHKRSLCIISENKLQLTLRNFPPNYRNANRKWYKDLSPCFCSFLGEIKEVQRLRKLLWLMSGETRTSLIKAILGNPMYFILERKPALNIPGV